MTDIIIDLETLGTRPGCPIIEIGACAIDPCTGRITANFSRRVLCPLTYDTVDRTSKAKACSLPHDRFDTMKWWMGDEERKDTLRKILGAGIPLRDALIDLTVWSVKTKRDPDGIGTLPARIWANGPSFDIAILAEAYVVTGLPRPWLCYDERCVRTALEMANYEKGSVSWIERGPRHRALNDARHEARKLYLSGALGEVSMIARRMRQRGTVKGNLA